MAHQLTHSFGEVISAADIDRHFALIEQGITDSPSGIRHLLSGQLQLSELSPSLQSVILQAISTASPVSIIFTVPVVPSTTVPLGAAPAVGSEEAFLNGMLMTPVIDYNIVNTDLILTNLPSTGDIIIVRFSTVTPVLSPLGNFTITHKSLKEMRPTPVPGVQEILVYGDNAGTMELAKYNSLNLTQVGTGQDVDSGSPDNSIIAFTAELPNRFAWVIGAPTGGGANSVSKIRVDQAALPLIYTVTHPDATVVISSLVTDGAFIYAFAKGGSGLNLFPNSIIKITAAAAVPTIAGVISGGTGITTIGVPVGVTDMAISNAGAVYVSMSDVNAVNNGQVRKYDPLSGDLLKIFTPTDMGGGSTAHPIRVIAANDGVYVLDDLQDKIFAISSGDVVSTIPLISLPPISAPTDIMFDGVDLWVSSGQVLYKLSGLGTGLNQITPAAETILDIMYAQGLVWTSYSTDTLPTDVNLTKLFPGLPGGS